MKSPMRGPSASTTMLPPRDPDARPKRTPAVRLERIPALLLGPGLLLLAGCAGGGVSADPSNSIFSISPGTVSIDTNCTGCNGTNAQGIAAEQLTATLAGGGPATVTWTLSGGDANSGTGTITAAGQYTPPSYLTADRVQVEVTATMNKSLSATAVLTVTPGFLQPLSPENGAVPAGGQVTITGTLAEAGGNDGISFALANSATGSAGGLGRAQRHQLPARNTGIHNVLGGPTRPLPTLPQRVRRGLLRRWVTPLPSCHRNCC